MASKQTLDLDALQALDAFELGELCTEADMSTREAIAFSRALRRRAAGGGAGAGRPAFGSSLGGSAAGSARRPAPPEPAPWRVVAPNDSTTEGTKGPAGGRSKKHRFLAFLNRQNLITNYKSRYLKIS